MLRGVQEFYVAGSEKIDSDSLDSLRKFLRDMPKEELISLEDHKDYLLLLSKFRRLIENVTRQNGERFLETIKQILSVGSNGLYTNKMRFLFELIQNVDDCDYIDDDTPHLSLDFNQEKKQLVLRYNEVGFTPTNVFSITGIAEEAKNIVDGKLQIGEKGIGFKSVFGVASHVRIRSGKFSFSLERDHFTIPILEYDEGFSGVRGTELTLQFESEAALLDVFDSVMQRYRKDGALFTQNPIVFLNKLEGMEFNLNGERVLSFGVSRPQSYIPKGLNLTVCKGMTLTLHRKGRMDKPITGTCYTTWVEYTREDCQSRYGERTLLTGRKMRIEAFFPEADHAITDSGRGSIEHGVLYSFLPTQVELEVPIICHAPFKLDASREYVDSQNCNLWFQKTISALKDFIHTCYCLHAKEVKEKIIAYIPKYNKNFFVYKNNAKLDELLKIKYGLDGASISEEDIFYCNDGRFYSSDQVVSFVKCEEIDQPVEVLRLCRENRPYFSSSKGFYPGGYNIYCVENPYQKLFSEAFLGSNLNYEDARKSVDLVLAKVPHLIHSACKEVSLTKLNAVQLRVLSDVGELRTLVDAVIQGIKRGTRSNVSFNRNSERVRSVFEILDEGDSVSYSDMGRVAAKYFKDINGNCIVLDGIKESGFYFLANNFCVVAGDDPASKIIEVCRKLDPDSLFSVRLKLKKASVALDDAMTTDDPQLFLNELRNIRMASRDAMGERAYKSYLDLIQKSGSATGRYINEIIQNADDCLFPASELPTLSIHTDSEHIVIETNEVGFTASNVRAITAIGESTKNMLLESDGKSRIGEKGVGFKTVFAIADSVEVHSAGFDFILKAHTPTIPDILKESSNQAGTIMRLNLKEGVKLESLAEKDVLELCICLRTLRRIKINEYDIEIADIGNTLRRVVINGKVFEFFMSEHNLEISDARVVQNRNKGGKNISSYQKIRCYVPTEINVFEYPLYCGLPMQVKVNSPVIIDAPFELTTSRDAVLEDSEWNKIILNHLYDGIIETAELIRDMLRINVLFLFGIEKAELKSGVLSYKVKMFNGVSENFLNNEGVFIDKVRRANIIPVKGSKDLFYSSEEERLRVFPEFLARKYYENQGCRCPFEIVDFEGGIRREYLRLVLDAFKVPKLNESEFWQSVEAIGSLSDLMMCDDFRKGLYSFLRNSKNRELSFSRAIVPVVTESGTKYVSYDDGKFFYSQNRRVSTDKYYILNTEILDRNAFEAIFDDELREMNAAQEREFYCDSVCMFLYEHENKDNYEFVQRELKGSNSENLQLCMPTIISRCKHKIPLKNLNGAILTCRMFILDNKTPIFEGQLLKSIIVHNECLQLARLLDSQELHSITYSALPNEPWEITKEDINDIKKLEIQHLDEILFLAVKNGRISEEVAVEFGITIGLTTEVKGKFEFPEEPLKDIERLKRHVQEELSNPIKIVSKQVLRAVDFCVTSQGKEFELNSREARQLALRRYSPNGRLDVCFCQMCLKSKRVSLIEVNNIEKRPKLFLPEMRLSLCLECSKKFELLRNQKDFCDELISKIKRMSAPSDKANVLLRMLLDDTRDIFQLTFTRTHFAEIQEILRYRQQIEHL